MTLSKCRDNKLVLDMGMVPDVWTPYELEKKGTQALAKYKVAFLSDCPVLSAEANAALRAFVEGGGILIGTGHSPAHDLRGQPLEPALLKATANDGGPTQLKLGQGRIVWNAGLLGRQYWGKVRREAVYGNTPRLYVEQPDPQRTPQMRRKLRETLLQQTSAAGYRAGVELDPRTGQVHLATYTQPNGETLLFLLHKGEGRIYNAQLKINIKGLAPEAKVLADFDKELTATTDAEGNLTVPAFTHCTLVRLSPKP